MSRFVSVRTLAVLLGSALLLAGFTQAQTTWYVDDDAPDDPGPGDPTVSDPLEDGSAAHPFDAIQEGINAASDGDTVLVLDGTYTGAGNRDMDFFQRAITLRSENGPESCHIDCGNLGRAFYFDGGEAETPVVDGFTIRNGHAVAGSPGGACGGAVYCVGGSAPSIGNCVISGNTADQRAGGIYGYESSPTIADCTIADNDCISDRGAGLCFIGSQPTITGCTIRGNHSDYISGGIHLTGYTAAMITNCVISDNSAANLGGGMYCEGSTSVTITNCAFTGNSANRGGAIVSEANSAPMLLNCTIAGNGAVDGAALACHSSGPYPSSVTMVNCIVWNGGDEVWNSDGSTITITHSDVEGGWPGIGNIDADPLFADPNSGDYHLAAGSPCIDAGCNCGVPADTADLDDDGDTDEPTPLDLDNEGRFFDDPDIADTGSGCPPVVDMGAYEYGDAGPQPCVGDLDCDRDVDLSDLAELLAHYGVTSGATYTDGDLDCDGDVDLADLAALLAMYGTTCD